MVEVEVDTPGCERNGGYQLLPVALRDTYASYACKPPIRALLAVMHLPLVLPVALRDTYASYACTSPMRALWAVVPLPLVLPVALREGH